MTGSEGHLGAHLCALLLARGWRVRGFDLEARHGLHHSHPQYQLVRGDVRSQGAVKDAAKGCEAVFHLAMRLWTGAEDGDELLDIAESGTRHAAAAAGTLGVRMVFVGSAAAVGVTPHASQPLTESSWNERPRTPYAVAKLRAERNLLGADGRGVDWVTVLPSMIVGPSDPSGTPSNRRIEAMFALPRQPIWFDGGLNLVDVRDVALGCLMAFERGGRGERYLLSGHNRTFRALLDEVSVVTGRTPLFRLRAPSRLLLRTAGFIEIVAPRFGREPFVTVDQLRGRLRDLAFFDHCHASRALSYTVRDLDQTLADTHAWWSRNRGRRRFQSLLPLRQSSQEPPG